MQRRNNDIYEEGEEEEEEDGLGGLETVRENLFEGRNSVSMSMSGENCVYVGVGKGDSSMGALRWALDNLITSSSTLLFLIHVFPETRFIPYPWRLPREQASQEQLEIFMAQEREKRRTLLHKFLQACSASKVKVELVLVESDSVGEAIQDLIPILNIKKLVLGIKKSSVRKSKSLGKGNSVSEQIMKSSGAEMCEVKIICQGEEIKMEAAAMTESSPSKSPTLRSPKKDQSNDHFFSCFYP